MGNLEQIQLTQLHSYDNNARVHSPEQLQLIANSIAEFGFIAPVIIDENNTILVGHGRAEAAKMAGLSAIPCRRITHLSENQKRAYILADNKLSDLGEWNYDLLETELENIDLDLSQFGFELDDITADVGDFDEDDEDGGYYGDERERTNRAYNLDILDPEILTNDFWQMPIINDDGYIPKDLIGFNYAKTSRDKNVGIHFYIDDYQFERVWNYPEKYVDLLAGYDCILTPDFSLYMDMPMPMKIWNIYRSRQIGAYYQRKGLKVIPTISWAEKETFDFCFQGIPKGSIVSISTIGVKRDKAAMKIWADGVTEMIKRIEPRAILIYGGELDYDYGNIPVYYYNNKVTENWSG